MTARASSFQDLARKLNINLASLPKHKKTVKMSGGSGSQVIDTTPTNIYCHIRSQCVDIEQPKDGSGIYWPFCAIVPRCSGCCDFLSHFQSCQPTRISNQTVEVLYIPYSFTSGSRSSRSVASQNILPRSVPLSIEVHEQCGCQCRLTPSSCNPRQHFVWDICGCECKTTQTCGSLFKWNDKECKCKCNRPISKCDRDQIWSDEACGCVCRKTSCTPPKTFNMKTCACEQSVAAKALKNFLGQFG